MAEQSIYVNLDMFKQTPSYLDDAKNSIKESLGYLSQYNTSIKSSGLRSRTTKFDITYSAIYNNVYTASLDTAELSTTCTSIVNLITSYENNTGATPVDPNINSQGTTPADVAKATNAEVSETDEDNGVWDSIAGFFCKVGSAVWNFIEGVVATFVDLVTCLLEGLFKLVEAIVDATVLLTATLVSWTCSAINWIFGTEIDTDAINNWTMSFVANDFVGSVFHALYTKTGFGKWMAENSILYDTVVRDIIVSAVPWIGIIVIGAVVTYFTGGTATPAYVTAMTTAMGAAYGMGSAAQNSYAKGDSYYAGLGKAAINGAIGAIQGYGIGQVTTAAVGVLKSSQSIVAIGGKHGGLMAVQKTGAGLSTKWQYAFASWDDVALHYGFNSVDDMVAAAGYSNIDDFAAAAMNAGVNVGDDLIVAGANYVDDMAAAGINSWDDMAAAYGYNSVDDMLAATGYNNIDDFAAAYARGQTGNYLALPQTTSTALVPSGTTALVPVGPTSLVQTGTTAIGPYLGSYGPSLITGSFGVGQLAAGTAIAGTVLGLKDVGNEGVLMDFAKDNPDTPPPSDVVIPDDNDNNPDDDNTTNDDSTDNNDNTDDNPVVDAPKPDEDNTDTDTDSNSPGVTPDNPGNDDNSGGGSYVPDNNPNDNNQQPEYEEPQPDDNVVEQPDDNTNEGEGPEDDNDTVAPPTEDEVETDSDGPNIRFVNVGPKYVEVTNSTPEISNPTGNISNDVSNNVQGTVNPTPNNGNVEFNDPTQGSSGTINVKPEVQYEFESMEPTVSNPALDNGLISDSDVSGMTIEPEVIEPVDNSSFESVEGISLDDISSSESQIDTPDYAGIGLGGLGLGATTLYNAARKSQQEEKELPKIKKEKKENEKI